MTKQINHQIIGIIPARYNSTRLPGKPLHTIHGKTLIQHVWEQAKECHSFDALFVATDDNRIADHVQGFGGEAIMTSIDCQTGTDRIIEAYHTLRDKYDPSIIVGIQGDELCLAPQVIEQTIQCLADDPIAVMSTPVVPLVEEKEALDHSVVKCVLNQQGYAMYFSRALIPAGHQQPLSKGHPYYKHLGLYCWRKEFLLQWSTLAQTPLQIAEDLEQLKVLEHGFPVKAAIVDCASIGVDTPEDLKQVEKQLCKQNISS